MYKSYYSVSHTHKHALHTHASQCTKNNLSLAIFFQLNQAEVTVTEMREVAVRMTDSSSSPSKKSNSSLAERHDDIAYWPQERTQILLW